MARVKYLLVLVKVAYCERFSCSLPRDTLEEWLVVPCLDGPISDWNSYPVQACSRDIGKVLLGLGCQRHLRMISGRGVAHNEGLVVLFHDFCQVVWSNPVESASGSRDTWMRLTLVIACTHRWLWVWCSGIVRIKQVQ